MYKTMGFICRITSSKTRYARGESVQEGVHSREYTRDLLCSVTVWILEFTISYLYYTVYYTPGPYGKANGYNPIPITTDLTLHTLHLSTFQCLSKPYPMSLHRTELGLGDRHLS